MGAWDSRVVQNVLASCINVYQQRVVSWLTILSGSRVGGILLLALLSRSGLEGFRISMVWIQSFLTPSG